MMRRLVTVLCIAAVAGCASRPPSVPVDPDKDDATPVVWGDEYDGVALDIDREFDAAPPASFAADATTGATDVASARMAAGPLAARLRATPDARAGAVEWRSARVHAVAGSIRPTLADRCVLADARDAGVVIARGSRTISGLRVSPSSSTWGSVEGAGLAALVGPLRMAAAAWELRDDRAIPSAWASVDWRSRTTVAGVAAGGNRGRPETVSCYAARVRASVLTAGEVAVGRDGVGASLRVVAGERGEWRGAVAAGPVRAPTDSPDALARNRWGAAVERRDTWRALSSRSTLSSRTRRTPDGDDRRRRAEWAGEVRVADGVRLEFGVRATRDASLRATALLEEASAPDIHDDVRARVVLRTVDVTSDATRIEFAYRVDAVSTGTGGRPGLVIAWQGRMRRGPIDARVQASAHDLATGQLATIGRPALPGAASFATVSHRGADVAAAVRVTGPGPFTLGVQMVAGAPGDTQMRIQLGVAW